MSDEQVIPQNEGQAAEVTESAPVENEGQQAAETPEGGEPQKEKQTPWFQKRIDDLTYHRREAERRAEALESQLRHVLTRQPEQAPPQEQQPEVNHPGLPPDKYAFDTDAQYEEAARKWQKGLEDYTRHVYRQEMAQLERQAIEQQQRLGMMEHQKQIGAKMAQVMDDGTKRFQDFAQVAFIPEPVADIVAEYSSDPAAIAYFWGKNDAERDRIVRLSIEDPRRAAAEIVKTDAKLSSQKKPTGAPPPPNAVKGGGIPRSEAPSDDDDMATWLRKREAQLKR